eukprot:511861_1
MVRDTKKETKVYKSVVKGKLNLKTRKFKKKQKRKRNKTAKRRQIEIKNEKEVHDDNINNKKDETVDHDEKANNTEYKGFKSDFEKAMDELTESEKQFLQRQKANESYFITQQSKMTHRQRIEKYNNNLANLSEHHDIPKVGPG